MRYFSADFHISHANIILYSSRPFANVEEMNREIIARHNAIVTPDDVVYNLGDFALNEKYVPDVLRELNGTHHLVAGNHDRCFSSHKGHKRSVLKYLGYGFSSVQERLELQIGNRTVLLAHMPYANPKDPDQRYQSIRPQNNGQFLLHGHVHEKWLINGRQINVGVDQWNFTPVSETTIAELMADIVEGEQE